MFAVDKAVVLVVDKVAGNGTVEVSAVDKVVVDEVSAVDWSFEAAVKKERLGLY